MTDKTVRQRIQEAIMNVASGKASRQQLMYISALETLSRYHGSNRPSAEYLANLHARYKLFNDAIEELAHKHEIRALVFSCDLNDKYISEFAVLLHKMSPAQAATMLFLSENDDDDKDFADIFGIRTEMQKIHEEKQ